jgi:hypothetical protein
MDKNLRINLTAQDKGASKVIQTVESQGISSSQKIGSAFGRMSGLIGGELGEVLDKIGTGFDNLGDTGGSKLATKLAVGGTAIAAVGALLTSMGSKEKAASDQLDVSIENTGHRAKDFSGAIEETVTHMEKYGDTAVTTKNALTTLTNATHDPTKALDLMGTAADLAAAQHISLSDAALQLAKGLNGSGRIFKQYGIEVHKNANGTKDYAGAVDALAKVINGQANAAVNNWSGRLKGAETHILDMAGAIGEKLGPEITAVGIGMNGFAAIAQISAARAVKANAEIAASNAAVAKSAQDAAASEAEMGAAGAGGTAKLATGAGTLNPALAGVAAALVVNKMALDEAAKAGQRHGKSTENLLHGLMLVGPATSFVTGKLFDLFGATKKNTDATDQASQAIDTYTSNLAAWRSEAAADVDATMKLIGVSLSAEQAQVGVASAAATATAAFRANRGSVDLATQAGVTNRQNLDSWIGALNTQYDAMSKVKNGQQAATAAYLAGGKALLNMIAQTDGTNSAAYRLYSRLLDLSNLRIKDKQFTVTANTDAAEQRVQALGRDVARLLGAIPINPAPTNPGGLPGIPGATPGNAAGTDDWRGGPTWVGELGPEIVNLPRHSQVIPNNRLGGGDTYVVNYYGGVIGTQNAVREIASELDRLRRQHGHHTSILKV